MMEPRVDNAEASLPDLAWLAGIIDGEGSITYQRHNRKSGEPGCPSAMVYVVNTNWLIISGVRRLFHKITGGHYGAREMKTRLPNRSRIWQVFVHRKSAVIAILDAVLPYLKGKREQALCALELARSTNRNHGPVNPSLFGLVDRIRHLNKNQPQPDRMEAVTTGRRPGRPPRIPESTVCSVQ